LQECAGDFCAWRRYESVSLCVGIFVASHCLCVRGGEEPVYFGDLKVKTGVENALGIPDPTPTDMLDLIELNLSGDINRQDTWIEDLTGLEYATNLQSLNLCLNGFDSIAPLSGLTSLKTLSLRMNRISSAAPLSGLTNLETLDLSRNAICDLSPLSGLTRLTYLNLHQNRLADLSPLSGLTHLTYLNIHQNYITDLTPLSTLVNLREMDTGANSISDLSPLASLTQLSILYAWKNRLTDLDALSGLTALSTLDVHINQIDDISALSALANLRNVDLASNQIADVRPLLSLRSLSHLDLRSNPLPQKAYDEYIPQIAANNPQALIEHDSHVGHLLLISSMPGGVVVDPGEGEFLYEHEAKVPLEARAEPGFVFVGWSGTYASRENPWLITLDKDVLIRADFVSLEQNLYVDDDAPGDPGPGDSTVSDPNEDGSPEHPLDSIEEAIQTAGEGVLIFVHPGTYHENIDCLGKDIQLIGAGPNGPGAPPYPVIEAVQAGPVVRCSGRSGQARLLSGFVITGGRDGTAGAILARDTNLTLSHCLLVGNRTTDPNGAALYASDSDIVATNCTIADNAGGPESAALTLVRSNLTLTNSILWDDTPAEVLVLGTGKPDIRYCAVRGWWPDVGNIHADPLFARPGCCIDPQNPENALSPQDVRAVLLSGDYHLQSQGGRWSPEAQAWIRDDLTSPCIDHGDKNTSVGNEPAPNGGIANMGAYGGTSEASKSP
jgi:Leucine-rich repeat (LRR) protein